MKIVKENKNKLLILLGFIIIVIIIILSILNKGEVEEDLAFTNETTTTKKITEKKYVDVKGSVVNPGVYEFKDNDRVIDAIKLAGGLKNNANTSNINLSQKLTSEMVIYVYSNSEINNNTPKLSCDTICKTEVIEVNNCIETNNQEENKETQSNNNSIDVININTASLDELKTLPGIGESKAKNIIEYRSSNGKFNTIEDIKNISGIGEALFNKIKDKITV